MNKRAQTKKGLNAALSITALMFPLVASSATVVLDKTEIYEDQGNSTYQFTIDTAGKYQATLSDYALGDRFDDLYLNIFDGNQVYANVFDGGSFSFDAQAGQFYAYVWGDAADVMGLGLYNVKVELLSASDGMVVPIPSAGILLLSIMGFAGAAGLRKLM